MKTLATTLLATGMLAAGAGYALADTIVIAPEQQKVIHEFVVKQNTAPVVLPSDTTVEVGTVVPDSVEIHTLDVPDMQTRYDYMVVNGQTVLVDPGEAGELGGGDGRPQVVAAPGFVEHRKGQRLRRSPLRATPSWTGARHPAARQEILRTGGARRRRAAFGASPWIGVAQGRWQTHGTSQPLAVI